MAIPGTQIEGTYCTIYKDYVFGLNFGGSTYSTPNFYGFLWYLVPPLCTCLMALDFMAKMGQEARRKRINAICWYGIAMGISNLWIILAGKMWKNWLVPVRTDSPNISKVCSITATWHTNPYSKNVLSKCLYSNWIDYVIQIHSQKSKFLCFFFDFLQGFQQSSGPGNPLDFHQTPASWRISAVASTLRVAGCESPGRKRKKCEYVN